MQPLVVLLAAKTLRQVHRESKLLFSHVLSHGASNGETLRRAKACMLARGQAGTCGFARPPVLLCR